MLQYGRQDLVSGRLRLTDLSPAEWRERDERALTEAMATGAILPYEKEFLRKDGSRVPVLIGAALFQGTNEGVVFVLDLSEQKRAEEKIRSRKWNSGRCWTSRLNMLRYSDPIANAFMPTASCSITSALVWKSGGGDLSRGEFIHPDDRERADGHFDRAVSSGLGFELELRLRKA